MDRCRLLWYDMKAIGVYFQNIMIFSGFQYFGMWRLAKTQPYGKLRNLIKFYFHFSTYVNYNTFTLILWLSMFEIVKRTTLNQKTASKSDFSVKNDEKTEIFQIFDFLEIQE